MVINRYKAWDKEDGHWWVIVSKPSNDREHESAVCMSIGSFVYKHIKPHLTELIPISEDEANRIFDNMGGLLEADAAQ